MGDLDKDEQKNLMRRTSSNLIEMYFQVIAAPQDGNMKVFGFALKRRREEREHARTHS